jgi:flagellar basal body-associated protein FliL
MADEIDSPPWRRNDDREPPFGNRGDRERPHYEEPHRSGLILALGIMGIAVCGVCGIFAWFMGSADLRKMNEGRMNPDGRGLTQAGRIMGLISMIIMVLTAFAMAGMFGLMFFFGLAAPPAAPAPVPVPAPAPAFKVNNKIQPAPLEAPNR